MRKSAIISAAVLLTCLLLACACSQNNQQEGERAEISTAPLSFEAQNFKKQSPNCKSDTVSCATVQASYLLAVGGPDSVRQNINDTLMHYLKASLAIYAVEDEEFRIPLDQVAQRFIADYESLRKDNPSYDIPWEVETETRVLYQSSKLASVQYATYSYAGGAHPNSFSTLLILDKLTGAKLGLSDFIDLGVFKLEIKPAVGAALRVPIVGGEIPTVVVAEDVATCNSRWVVVVWCQLRNVNSVAVPFYFFTENINALVLAIEQHLHMAGVRRPLPTLAG